MVRDGKIALIEIFKSIDGEATNAGKPSVFIRTFGCNLRCKYCDTKYSWTETAFKKVYSRDLLWMSVKDIVLEVLKLTENWVFPHATITGGEPLVEENQPFMMELLSELSAGGVMVDFETDGAIDYSEIYANVSSQGGSFIMDWKLPYSGQTDKMIQSNLDLLRSTDVVKMVVSDDPEDWKEVERVCKWIYRGDPDYFTDVPQIYLSPCFGKVDLKKIPEFILNHPEWYITAQIQLHKVFWLPETLGV